MKMSRFLTLSAGCIMEIIMFLEMPTGGQIQQNQIIESRVLTLKDYPRLFRQNTIVVVGENATQIEYEVAKTVVNKIEMATKEKIVIKKDAQLTGGDKFNFNLIVIGTPCTNSVLREIYETTPDATKVTNEWPGENKGILEILKNPWNSNKALLIIAGSDEWGVKAGSEMLRQAEKNKSSVIVEWGDFGAKTIKFDCLSNPYNLSNPTETAKLSLNKKYGENWFKRYQVGWHYKYPSISFDHWLIRINPDFCILVTFDKVYFLSPEDFNKFLELYGNEIKLEKDRDVIYLFEIYLNLYGLSSSVQDEEIFTKRHLKLWTAEIKEKYNVDPEEFTHIEIKRENSYYLLDCYTITRISSYPRVPSPQDIIISHYSVKVGNKGQIYLNLIDRTKYEEAISAGPR